MTSLEQQTSGVIVRAIGLYSFAILLLSLMDVLIKWLSAEYSTVQIVFFRSLFGLLPLVVLIPRSGGLAALKTKRWSVHLLRGLIGLATALCFFFAFGLMPLADAYAIAFAAPLVMTALSGPILGEAVGLRRWLAVVFGFLGVIVMLRPGTAGIAELLGIGSVAAIAGTVFFALVVLLTRKISRSDSNAAIIFHGGMVAVAGSGLLLPLGFTMPDLTGFLLLAGVGLLGGVGVFFFTEALRQAPVAILAPFDYTAMIWAVVFGYAIWADLPDGWTVGGSAIVIASGLYVLHRETRRGAIGEVLPRAMPKPSDTTIP